MRARPLKDTGKRVNREEEGEEKKSNLSLKSCTTWNEPWLMVAVMATLMMMKMR